MMSTEETPKRDCKCTGPWDCQCQDVLNKFYERTNPEDLDTPYLTGPTGPSVQPEQKPEAKERPAAFFPNNGTYVDTLLTEIKELRQENATLKAEVERLKVGIHYALGFQEPQEELYKLL